MWPYASAAASASDSHASTAVSSSLLSAKLYGQAELNPKVTPQSVTAQPDEVANAVAYLALQAPASMTGAVIDINGASFVR